ncbi:11532_t:CDS:2 [Acaulospora morrowiae]|uniref:BLOC-1-related complex subunit 7 n=1 Tax=Acaulospora morrowiae TaxID=94023 RepID=A0A9N9HQQ5_9GLOM|nr:11532_t:CDS:2 [Acaulospora morrowiae]
MKPELNEKSQNAFLGLRGIVKAIVKNSNGSEEVMRTARLFANIDVSMKSTHQSLEKLTSGITQLQERNVQILNTLYVIPQISDNLKVDELIKTSSNDS